MKERSVKTGNVDKKICNALKQLRGNKDFMSSENMKALQKASSNFNKMLDEGIVQKRGNNLMTREDLLSLNFYH
jgi:hypothetical protein